MADRDHRVRASGGFSLDDAARLYRSSATTTRLACPTCGGRMRDVLGQQPAGRVSMLRCEACGRGLVFDRPPDR